MIEDINEFVIRMETTPTYIDSTSAAACKCSGSCTCGADYQMWYANASMNQVGTNALP